MSNSSKLTNKPSITEVAYPYNLLNAVVQHSPKEAPPTMTEDQIRGLQYAMSTLEPREYEVLMYRYNSKLTLGAIAEIYGVSVKQMRQIEGKALRKLRSPSRWNYIRLGIVGYWQRRKKEYYEQGYCIGYAEGYQKGFTDGKEGREQAFKSNPALSLIIENLHLSTRAMGCLQRLGCVNIGDVVDKDKERIIRVRGMGKATLNEIAQALCQKNITGTVWDQFLLPE